MTTIPAVSLVGNILSSKYWDFIACLGGVRDGIPCDLVLGGLGLSTGDDDNSTSNAQYNTKLLLWALITI